MLEHKQVIITYQGQSDYVDEGIADLILNLWKLEINTVMSCEHQYQPGNKEIHNKVWIMFDTADDASKFLNLVHDYKIMDEKIKKWGISTVLHDYNMKIEIDEENDNYDEIPLSDYSNLHLNISVRFPIKQLKLVKKRIASLVKE